MNKHVQELLECSANLRTISGNFDPTFFDTTPSIPDSSYIGTFPPNKYRYLTEAHRLSAAQLLRLAGENPQLKNLSLVYPGIKFTRNDKTNARLTIDALNLLFRSSYKSLRKIACSLFQLAVISKDISDASLPLKNVYSLDLYSVLKELEYLKYINFQGMFPRLSEIWILTCDRNEALDSRLLASDSSDSQNMSRVKILHLHNYIPLEYLQIIKSTFPNVESFSFHGSEGISQMCEALWRTKWERITKLHFCTVHINFPVEENMFGLSHEERTLIESQDLDVKKMHHTYSQYSAFNLNGLKTIKLEFEECQYRMELSTLPPCPCNEMQTFPLVSRMTAEQISRRLPKFEMEISIKPEYVTPNAQINHHGYSDLLIHPGFFTTNCLHKHFYPQTRNWNDYRLKKSKFTVVFQREPDSLDCI